MTSRFVEELYCYVTESPFHPLPGSLFRVYNVSVLVWIVYDIVDDKVRGRVAKACKQYGLERVQKSVFLGKLKSSRFDELGEKCISLINEDEDSVYLFPFCQDDFRRIKVLGQGFDKKLINEEILSKFF